MANLGWKDLLSELLLNIASFCNEPNALKVCHAWKSGLETVTTQLILHKSELPLNLGSRFQSLTSLDLHHISYEMSCPKITSQGLVSLRGLPLASITLVLRLEEFTREAAEVLLFIDPYSKSKME